VIEIVRLRSAHVEPLLRFHAALESGGETALFAPHPFTATHLHALCNSQRKDLHYVVVMADDVVGYGLLRGWDEGYAIPSLGIAIHPRWRRAGLGTALMHFLHVAARAVSATSVRLRFHPSNRSAQALYERVGYRFEPQPDGDGYRVAFKDLQA
jgi:ribosomal protein S18 acetylase RimI-like enzyme